jgi:hypothetical protein
MSTTLVILVSIIYLYVCIEQYFSGNTPMAIVYFGYTVANIGLILTLK